MKRLNSRNKFKKRFAFFDHKDYRFCIDIENGSSYIPGYFPLGSVEELPLPIISVSELELLRNKFKGNYSVYGNISAVEIAERWVSSAEAAGRPTKDKVPNEQKT